MQPAPEGPISEMGGGTVGSGWQEFDGGYPPLKLDSNVHQICYLCCWPKFGLVNFIQPKEQGPFAGCCAGQPLDFSHTGMRFFTIYDMCKAVDRGMVMSDIRVMEKQGGKSGHWKAE